MRYIKSRPVWNKVIIFGGGGVYSLLYFLRKRKLFPPCQWYSGAILAIPKNLPVRRVLEGSNLQCFLILLESLKIQIYLVHIFSKVGRDDSVGIATRYKLDGPEIECRWGRGFPHPPIEFLGPPSFLYNGYRVISRGKAAGAWRWPSTPSTAEVKERTQLYVYSPSRPSWPVLGWL